MTRFILLLLVLLLNDFCCAGSQLQQNSFRLNVSAKKTLHVTRGKNVAISSEYYSIVPSGHPNSTITCNMVYIDDNENCGHISPTILPCWDQGTAQLYYQHHGCFNHYETLHFQVDARMTINNTATVAIQHLGLSLRVSPNQNVSLKIQTAKDDKGNVMINFLFPTFFTGKCSYTVMDHLPSYKGISGSEVRFNGSLSLPIPCGYSPTTPFTYSSRRLSSVITSVFVHTNCFRDDSTYYTVPLTSTDAPNKSTHPMKDHLLHLNDSYMNINELSETLLLPGTLPIDLQDFQGHANERGLKFLFPVEYTGGFYSYLSPPQNPNTATTFTLNELLRNRVVFKPTERSIATHVTTVTMFQYYLLDFIGKPLARGTLYVKLSPRKGRDPSIRKNIGISVERGGKAFITSNELNLYPPHLCTNYTVRIMSLPRLGSVYINGNDTPLGSNDTFQVEENNLNILYVQDHSNASHYASDATLWSLECDMVKKQDGIKEISPLHALIPIRIASSPTTTQCTVVTLSQCVTPIHMNECSLPAGPVTITTSKQPVEPEFIATPSSHCLTGSYPYYTLSRSQSCLGVINKHNRSRGNNTLWYMSHNVTSMKVMEYILSSTRYNHSVHLRVKILPRFNFVATKLISNVSINSPSYFPSVPFVQRNVPLPLSSPQPVYITTDYLRISSAGYLEKEIVYHITSQPSYGSLCLLDNTDCTSSINSFTQADLTANRIYYKPKSLTVHLVNDSFDFHLFYFEGREKLPQVIRFQFVSVEEISLLIPYKQFWISNEREKVLTRKYFRHIQWYMKTNRLHFRVISGPHHGTLHTPGTPKEFLWEDLTRRSVSYEHRPLEDHCSDLLTLQVTRLTDGFSTIANISIAIKTSPGDILSITTNDHPLELEKEFKLSEKDFELRSSFCLSFIKFKVNSLPSYGLLRYLDPTINVLKELNINSSFTGQDILEGRITYRVLPNIIFYRNTTDTFSTVLEDPQGIADSKSERPRRSSPSSVFLIILIQETLSELRLNLTVNPSIIMRTATDDRYSVTFTKEDIYLSDDSDFLPSEISLYLKSSSPPRFGHIQKDDYQISHFTLSDVYENKISYVSTLSHSDLSVTSDSFELIVKISYGNLTNPAHVESNVTVKVEWCYFNISGRARVDETADHYEYHVTYIGGNNLSSPVHVNVTTLEGLSDDAATPGIDYHPINNRLAFTSHSRKAVGYVSIINDSNAEGNELFVVGLHDSDVCIVPKHSEISVYITDYIDDYPLFSFSNKNEYFLPQDASSSPCSFSLIVSESVGSFNISILRTKNTLQRSRVICHTVPQFSTEYADYVGRPNNISSAVIFNKGVTQSNCTIRIIDDDENERKELFYVELKELVTENSFVNNGSSKVCVYIAHDKNDVPKVFFKNSTIVVQENFAGNLSFSIVRTGDLSGETTVDFQILPGNATENKDFDRLSNKIKFLEGQSEAEGFVNILQDNEKETNEVFCIRILPFNGVVSGNGKLEIIIQDTVKDMFVKFSSKTYQVNETSFVTVIPVYRHGNLSAPTAVICTTSPDTADDKDYFNTQRILTFQINETMKECHIFMSDDDIREGSETMHIVLSTNDSRVETDEALIIINDPEDAPVVEFEKPIVYITEPIPNFKTNYTEVQLSVNRRKGLNVKASLDYYTFENATMNQGSTKSYNSSKRRITFDAEVKRMNVTMPIHYDSLQDDEIFYAQLVENNETRLGQQQRMTIVVRNRILKGVYFPANPVIISYVNQSMQLNAQGVTLYHDLPLLCKTACDEWSNECTRQGINVHKTIYEWWISEDGKAFFQIKRDTFLTATTSRTLSPVYFSSNVWIKCVTDAVDVSGVKGYSITSDPVLIGNETFYKYQRNRSKIEIKFETYASFQGNEKKDFVELVVTLPALPNSIPLITSKPILSPLLYVLTHPSARSSHSCSNLIPSSSSRVTTSSLLYEGTGGLDKYLIRGVWVFRKWLQLKSILDKCPVSFSNKGGGNFSLSMPLYVTEFKIRNGIPVNISSSKHNMTLNNEQLPTIDFPSSFPFDYRPVEKSNYQKIVFSPHSIDVLPLNKIRLFGYTNYSDVLLQRPNIRISVGDSPRTLLPLSYEESNGDIINGWIIETSRRSNISFTVKLCLSSDDDALIGGWSNCESFTFKIPMTEIKKQLVLSSELESNAVILSEREAKMHNISGKNVLKLSVYFDHSFIMKPQRQLVVDGVILKHNEQERVLLDTLRERKSPSHVTMYFILDGMFNNPNSFILTNSSVRSNDHEVVYWESQTTANLPQFYIDNTPTPTAVTGTDDPIAATNSTLPVYAFMLILITAVILASVCTITCALLVYTLRQRMILKKKNNLIQDVPIEANLRINRPKQIPRRKGRDFKGLSSYSFSSSSSSPQSRGSYSPSVTSISDPQPSALTRSKSLPDLSSVSPPFDTFSLTPPGSTGSESPPTPPTEGSRIVLTKIIPIKERHKSLMHELWRISENARGMSSEMDERLSSSSSNDDTGAGNKGAPQGVGWYERFQTRQKSLELYSKMYSKATPAGEQKTDDAKVPDDRSNAILCQVEVHDVVEDLNEERNEEETKTTVEA